MGIRVLLRYPLAGGLLLAAAASACAPDQSTQTRERVSTDRADLYVCSGHAPFGGALQHGDHAETAEGDDIIVTALSDVIVEPSGRVADFEPWIPTRAGWLIRNPAGEACLSSAFGPRPQFANRHHAGVDLAAPRGGPIVAAAAGRIQRVERNAGYGLHVVIDHGGGVSTLYAHLRSTDLGLRPGRRVRQGQVIGRMGQSGNATGVHLHYEVRIDSRPVDPLFAETT